MPLRFVRRVDGLTYEFEREADPVYGHPSFRRVDAELYCRRLPEFGWCVVDSVRTVTSRPFDDAGVGDLPPEGAWVSRKGNGSYVYDLHRLPD
ncbi:MAG: hypothetical protein ACRDUX_35395, partial [Mycobacterium sp.]